MKILPASGAALLLLAAVPLPLACGGKEEPADPNTALEGRGRPGQPDRELRALRPVLAKTLAELGVEARRDYIEARELRSNEGLLPGDVDPQTGETAPEDVPADTGTPEESTNPDRADALPKALVELREGLIETVLGSPRQLGIAVGDIEAAGAGMAPILADGLRDSARSNAELGVLVDLSKAAPSRDVALALAHLTGASDEATLRAKAAFALRHQLGAEGADCVLPALVHRQKYEKDPDALTAVNEFVELTRGTEAPSDALRAETWRWIADMSGEHFQLRGVDDERFVLSRLGPWAAVELAQALEDVDSYVRLHTAQVLERMGPEGAGAFDSLAAGLADESVGVAGACAEALAAVSVEAPDRAADALLAELARGPSHALEVALVRALARLGRPEDVERMKAAFEGARVSDLKLAAASALLGTDHEPLALEWLADEMKRERGGDPAGAESTLDAWVARADATKALRRAWIALDPQGAVIHTREQARARRRAKADLLARQGAQPGTPSAPRSNPPR